MIRIKRSVLDKLRNHGYSVLENDDQVVILYIPPSISEASSTPSEPSEIGNVYIELLGKRENDEIVINEAYVVEGNIKKRRLDDSELEIWAEYLGE